MEFRTGTDELETKRSSRSPVPRPWVAETPTGSPSPIAYSSATSGSSASESTLFATTTTGSSDAAQDLGHLGVALAQPGAGVEHERDDVGVGDRLPGLCLDRPRERVLGGQVDATGVDELEPDPVPLAIQSLAVPGHAGLLVDDRVAPTAEPIGKRRLADVGKADDRDSRRATDRAHASPRSRAIPASNSITASGSSPVVSISTASVAA